MNRIYIFWFNDGGYECGDTCMTIIAKNKKKSIEIAKEEYGKYAYCPNCQTTWKITDENKCSKCGKQLNKTYW